MTAPLVVVATTCYGGQVVAQFTSSLLDTAEGPAAAGVGFTWAMLPGLSMVDLVRNRLVAGFLARPKAGASGLAALADRASTSIMAVEVGEGVHCKVTIV
jgi:hypothetical protein